MSQVARDRMIVTKDSHSRFHCRNKAQQPPDLRAVVRELKKAWRRRAPFIMSEDVRSIAKRACRAYDNRGCADDLVRFLHNVGALFLVEGRIYFDEAQAEHVLECCARGTDPFEPNGSLTERATIALSLITPSNDHAFRRR